MLNTHVHAERNTHTCGAGTVSFIHFSWIQEVFFCNVSCLCLCVCVCVCLCLCLCVCPAQGLIRSEIEKHLWMYFAGGPQQSVYVSYMSPPVTVAGKIKIKHLYCDVAFTGAGRTWWDETLIKCAEELGHHSHKNGESDECECAHNSNKKPNQIKPLEHCDRRLCWLEIYWRTWITVAKLGTALQFHQVTKPIIRPVLPASGENMLFFLIFCVYPM